ncbi:hypothetical protein QYF61_016389 [Mycteria americana]|uniref:Uncharacterized protein n=1 Tax=Mycteria americana TaxID=33587 RepID=A0AAN7NHV6_MYCAM|nr:hypothetical protein QYF61_016389 [Mycteria americana]
MGGYSEDSSQSCTVIGQEAMDTSWNTGNSDKILGKIFFTIRTEQPQFPQPLLIRLVLQTLHQLPCPSLDTLQHLNIPLVVGGPKLNTVFEVWPHQGRVQGHDHFPSPAGHAIFDTSQDAIGFLGHLGTLLAHIQAAVNQHPQVLLCLAAFQPLFPKPVALHGVDVAQVQDLALSLVEPHTIGPSPSIQPVQVPLQSLPTLKQINTPAQLGVICKLTEGALDPFVQIIDKDIISYILLKLELERDMKGNKKSFYRYTDSKRKAKENRGSLLNGARDLVPKDTGMTDVLIFTGKACPQASQVPEPNGRVWGSKALLITEENTVRDHLNHFDIYKSIGSDGIHLRQQKELADVIVRSLFIIFERSR